MPVYHPCCCNRTGLSGCASIAIWKDQGSFSSVDLDLWCSLLSCAYLRWIASSSLDWSREQGHLLRLFLPFAMQLCLGLSRWYYLCGSVHCQIHLCSEAACSYVVTTQWFQGRYASQQLQLSCQLWKLQPHPGYRRELQRCRRLSFTLRYLIYLSLNHCLPYPHLYCWYQRLLGVLTYAVPFQTYLLIKRNLCLFDPSYESYQFYFYSFQSPNSY